MGSINLEYLKQGFSSLLHQAENAVMPAFVYWLDLKIAEYKVNGFILTEIEPQCNDDWTQYIQTAVNIQRAPCENNLIEPELPTSASHDVNFEVQYPNQNVGDPVLQVSSSLFAKKKNRSQSTPPQININIDSNEDREDSESLVSIKSDPDEVIITDTPPTNTVEERTNQNDVDRTTVPPKEVLMESLSLVSKEQMSVMSKQDQNKGKTRVTRQQAEKERIKETPKEVPPKKSKFVTELLKTLNRSDSTEKGEVNIGGKKYLIAKQNADLLQSKNIRVIVTQSKDKFKELLERHNLPHMLANESDVAKEGMGIQPMVNSNNLSKEHSQEDDEIKITNVVKANTKKLSKGEGKGSLKCKSNGNVEQGTKSPVKRKASGSPASVSKKKTHKTQGKLAIGKTFLSRNMRTRKKSGAVIEKRSDKKVSTRKSIDLPMGNQRKSIAETTMESPLLNLAGGSLSESTSRKLAKQESGSGKTLRNSPSIGMVKKLTNVQKDLAVQRHPRQTIQNRHKLRRKSLGSVLLRLNPERIRPTRQRSNTQPSLPSTQNRRKKDNPNKVVGKVVEEKNNSQNPDKPDLTKSQKSLQSPQVRLQTSQKVGNVTSPRLENHQCGQCGLNFNSFPSYTRHLRTHKHEFNHMCDSCGIGFLNNESLKNHKCIRSKFKFLDKPGDK